MTHRTDDDLHLVALRIASPTRRRKARRLAAAFGTPILPDAIEVAGPKALIRRLLDELEAILAPEDEVRVYPICRSCRDRASLWGTVRFAELPNAWIF